MNDCVKCIHSEICGLKNFKRDLEKRINDDLIKPTNGKVKPDYTLINEAKNKGLQIGVECKNYLYKDYLDYDR